MDVLPSGASPGAATSSGWSGTQWSSPISIAPAGSLAAGLFDLYQSLGDATIATATNIPTTQDGPIQVARYGALTVDALLSVTNCCRGLIVLCDALTIGAAGGISMTGKGAKGNAGWIVGDLTIPESVILSARYGSFRKAKKVLSDAGWFVGDPNLWAFPPADLAALGVSGAITAGGVSLISASGCGVGATGKMGTGVQGGDGGAGSFAPGGGGSGAVYNSGAAAVSGWGGDAYPWGGGSASGGGSQNFMSFKALWGPERFCGRGGINDGSTGAGAGNPAGDGSASGVGGVLVVICRGNISIASGGIVQADGKPGVNGTYAGGGGSGGGVVCIIHGGTLSNAGTIRANGGAGGTGTYVGGAGGAGSVVTKTFAEMGW